MNKKRTRLEIIRDILEVIRNRSGKIKPTHILYKSNLSHQMMSDYLRELIKKSFIREERVGAGRTYIITEKGRTFLDKYSSIVEFTESFGLGDVS